jgi:hypothetical protein
VARYKNGITGSFSGKIGPVVGSSWKGIDYMRSKPRQAENPKITQKQIISRAKLSLASHFSKSMRELFAIGFREEAVNKTGTNCAVAYIVKNAIVGSHPALLIDCSKVLISRGILPNALQPAAVAESSGTIRFRWINNAGYEKAGPGDRALMVAYCEELNQTIYSFGVMRNREEDILDVSSFSGKLVQTWISFSSPDAKLIATSIFTGELAVQ